LEFIIILVYKSVYLAGIMSQDARFGGNASMTHFVFWCMVVLSTRSDDRNYEKKKESKPQSGHYPFEIYLEDWEIAFLI
jgi:hypothetical protein